MGWFNKIINVIKNPLDLIKDTLEQPLGPLGPKVPMPGINVPLDPTKITFKEVADIIKVPALEWLAKDIWHDKILENVDTHTYNLAGDWTKRQEFVRSAAFGSIKSPIGEGTGDSFLITYIHGPGISLRNYGYWSKHQWYFNSAYHDPYRTLFEWGSSGYTSKDILRYQDFTNIIQGILGRTVYVLELDYGPSDLRYWIMRHLARHHQNVPFDTNMGHRVDNGHLYVSVKNSEGNYVEEEVDISDYSDTGIFTYAAYGVTLYGAPVDVFIYKVGTNHPEIDVMLISDQSNMDYLPAIPLRVAGRWIDDTSDGELTRIYPVAKEALKKAYPGAKMDKVLASVKTQTLDHVITTFIQFGVSANTKNLSCKKYIWEFMQEMLVSVQKKDNLTFDSIKTTQSDAVFAALHDIQNQASEIYNHRSYEDWKQRFEVVGSAEIKSLPAYTTAWGSQRYNMNQGIQWAMIEHREGSGKYSGSAQSGNTWWELNGTASHFSATTMIDPAKPNFWRWTDIRERVDDENNGTGEWYYLGNDDDLRGTPARAEGYRVDQIDDWFVVVITHRFKTDDGEGLDKWTQVDYEAWFKLGAAPTNYNVATLVRQFNDNHWQSYTVYGMVFVNNVFRDNVVVRYLNDAVNEGSESSFIFPLHERVLYNMSLVDMTQVSTECAYMIFNNYSTTTIPWYAQDSFKTTVLVIVVIVTVVLTWGSTTGPATAGTAGLLGTAAEVGAALGFSGAVAVAVGTAANMLAAYALVAAIQMVATRLFGERVGQVVGIIASLAVGSYTNSLNTAQGVITAGDMLNVKNLMTLLSSVGNAYANYMKECQQKLVVESTEQLTLLGEKQSEVDAKNEQLFGMTTVLNTSVVTDSIIDRMEPSSSFLSRTLMTGTDLSRLSIDGIHHLTELTLSLDQS